MRRIQLVVISFAMALSVNAQTLPYLDESRSIEERVENLLSRLTVDEKIDLMRATSPANERLGFPKYYHGNEALHGVVRPGNFTVFPQAIGLASTWNPTLLNTISTAISDEARARWNELERGKKQTNQFSDLLTFWSPTVNMARDPRWGRTPETYGEDPFLTGEMGAAFVKGLQGDHPRYLKVVSTPKHFTANNEEHNRFECDAKISERWLREYYLPAFEACIRRGHAESIMSAYNAINGIPCTANPWLLNKVLRDEWGFKGYVVSDCGAVGNVWEDHHFTKRTETAAALCLKAGLDLECGDNFYIEPLHEAYKMGMVDDSDIDRAARRILTARMKLGFFDTSGNNPYDKISPSVIGSEKHRQLALEAAREAIVLLKNANRTLPLNKSKLKSIAVVGLNAATCEFGDYSGQPMTEPVSILQGIKDYVGDKVNVRCAPWESAGDSIGGNITAEAKEAARNSDVVIAVMGINRSIEREGKDRSDINLPADQKEFIKEMYKINKNVVLVIVAGSSLDLRWENENIPAIVNAWYPGQEGGTAVAEVLFGKYNPAGRLPLTYYNSVEDLPAFDDYDLSNRTYKYFKGGVLYPFGYGLSYSQFKYSNLIINEKENTIDVEFDVKNIGRYDGDEVAQVYVQLSEYEGVVPEKELRGFKRVHLKKGEKQRVSVSLRREDLRYWSESKSKFIYPAGVPKVMVGASSADIRLTK